MNIFVLDTNPAIAASYHCDQHLHKMILESAQMLSTMFHYNFPDETRLRKLVYKPAYENHPCTKWVKNSINNAAWLIRLCHELQDIRYSIGCEEHSSFQIVKIIDCAIEHSMWFLPSIPEAFLFAGPLQIAIRQDLNVIQKYRKYYRVKNQQWIRNGKGPMTWKNRTVPEWMTEWPKEDN